MSEGVIYFHEASNTHIYSGQSFSIDEIQYPANWLQASSNDQLIALGLVEVVTVGERRDERFFEHAETLNEATLTLSASPKPLAAVKAMLAEQIAASRYAQETGGIMIDGRHIATDRQSQAMLSAALQVVIRNPEAIVDWKGQQGWLQIDKGALETMADAVGTHVQACFSAERSRQEALTAITDFDELIAFDPAVTP